MWINRLISTCLLICLFHAGHIASQETGGKFLYEISCQQCADGASFIITDNFGKAIVEQVRAREAKLTFYATILSPRLIKITNLNRDLKVLEFQPIDLPRLVPTAVNVIGNLVVQQQKSQPAHRTPAGNKEPTRGPSSPPPDITSSISQPQSPPIVTLIAKHENILRGDVGCKYLTASDIAVQVFDLNQERGRELLFADLVSAIEHCASTEFQEQIRNKLLAFLSENPDYWCRMLERPVLVQDLLNTGPYQITALETLQCGLAIQELQFLTCAKNAKAKSDCGTWLEPLVESPASSFFNALYQLGVTGECPLPRKFPPYPPCTQSSMEMCLAGVVQLAKTCDATKDLSFLSNARTLYVTLQPQLRDKATAIFTAELEYLAENWQGAAELFESAQREFSDSDVRAMILCRHGQALFMGRRFREAEDTFRKVESLPGVRLQAVLAARLNRLHTRWHYLPVATKDLKSELEEILSASETIPCDSLKAAISLETGSLLAKTSRTEEQGLEILRRTLDVSAQASAVCRHAPDYFSCWPIDVERK